jgi:toxin ParE1/3/4
MIGFRLLPPAEEEMTESALLYESASSGLGENFLADVQRAITEAREHPAIGQPLGGGLRRTVLRRFPFSLIYAA